MGSYPVANSVIEKFVRERELELKTKKQPTENQILQGMIKNNNRKTLER
jgi:hypothetical protein